MSAPGFSIRDAEPGDVPELLAMIRELARFEHLEHLVENTPQRLHAALFDPSPASTAALAVADDHRALGFALFYSTFSTFLGKPGLWLEDLFVRPAFRGQGVGRALLLYGARLARERGCGRYEWAVLEWNRDAQGFYEKLGATVMPAWRIVRASGDALARMAAVKG